MTLKVQTLTHFPCSDGYTAAWLLNKVYPDAKQHHVNHGSKTPEGLVDSSVVFADFCYPLQQMRDIINVNANVTVLDHHKGAEAILQQLKIEFPGKFNYVFINEKSGAGIVADYFDYRTRGMSGQKFLIDAIEANDLWIANDYQKTFVEYVRSFPQTYTLLDELASYDPQNIITAIEAGEHIMRAKMQMVQQALVFARETTLHGYKIRYSNVPFFLCSETAHALIGDNLVGVTWYQDYDGRYKLSFRSTDEKSAMALAKLCGGNGHENSAGSTVDKLPWS